ncbi:hypothetical protein HHK36_015919 [Tetracentron sinense]|uniref:Uncharacterized protein n=1 Tax=Tetracentron sinense TaxID=13715 RepID=A0A834Z1W9_TETSI|nr:hypothetical protein HHK36_015919 [Tetracentron sinense]
MAISENSRQSPIPSFLYSTSSSKKTLDLEKLMNRNPRLPSSPSSSSSSSSSTNGVSKRFVIPAPSEPGKIEMYSPAFYAACTVGGILSCGLTHTSVTPLDLVKCNMQIDPAKYKSISSGFGILLKEQGVRGFFRGWVPTLLGYSAQGACKYGFYEFFKKYYSDIAGPEYATKYKTLIYLAGSASAEVIADIALCPMEAVKVRVQTQPGFARGLSDGLPKFVKSEGALGLYKGLVPLWGRQIPCLEIHVTTMKVKLKRDSLVQGPVTVMCATCRGVDCGVYGIHYCGGVILGTHIVAVHRIKFMNVLPEIYSDTSTFWADDAEYFADTMMKFASFETIVEMLYKYAIPTPKEQCSKSLQLGISFAGGYVAGVFCAIVSHPADNLVSFLNNAKGATVGDAVKKLGLWGLFTRGLPLRIIMIGTLTGAQWVIYDGFKVFVGLPTTGGVAPAAAPVTDLAKV